MKYKFSYFDDSIYGHVVNIVENMNMYDNGVHLDIACGYAAIDAGLKEHGFNFEYIGIDANEETVNYLKNEGIKAYCHTFSCDEDDFKYIEKIIEDKNIKLITALDFLEHIINPEFYLKTLNKICRKHNAMLIVSVPNICHRDIVFKMMEGKFDYTETGLLDKSHISLFSVNRLQNCMKNSGFEEVYCNDLHLKISDQHFPLDSTFLSQPTTIFKCLDSIKKSVDPFSTVNQFVRAYLPSQSNDLENNNKNSLSTKPFLSIITRTQGKRVEALKETFLCLTAQTNTDFEVLVIGHKLSEKEHNNVNKIIKELPEWMKKKVSLIKVDSGNRTKPLNIGFKMANGKYISILDDDDIVFDNWVEEFYNLFKKSPGCILHTYSLKQEWEEIEYGEGKALRAIGPPCDCFCKDFDLLEQLKSNFCPTMSYACPSYTFKELGIRFNENLSTVEDWDFLMRTALITGVSNSNKTTSIYRIWTNAENSYSLHDEEEWILNERLVRNNFKKIPIILMEQNIEKIAVCSSFQENVRYDLKSARLYADYGYGFSENTTIPYVYEKLKDDSFIFIFKNFSDKENVCALRFDPVEFSMILISNISVEIITKENEILSYNLNNLSSNGLKIYNGILFLKSDPQINIPLTDRILIKKVKIKFKPFYHVPDFVFNRIAPLKNKLKNKIKKILRFACK